MPKIDIAAIDWAGGSGYPAPFAARIGGRFRKRLGNAGGLDQFGVNLTRLEPGAMSALRHWHESEDEFVYVLEGELVLIEDEGETRLGPGDAAAFRAGIANGHHLVNRSNAPALYLEIGTRAADERAHYPDDDLAVVKEGGRYRFTRKDGTPPG
ncbi:MAG: cupin domain-containing protein [Alphaproteobacteria bacterium]|nr:MAG: cupin domain-containing protein [Alphaproteobacteria bacterium]